MTSLCLVHSHPTNENKDSKDSRQEHGHYSQDSAENGTFTNVKQTHVTSAKDSVAAFYADLIMRIWNSVI